MAVRGQYLRFSTELDEGANAAVRALGRALATSRPAGVREVYPALGSVHVEWDDAVVADDAVDRWIDAAIASPAAEGQPRHVRIEVRYGGEDAAAVAAGCGLAVEEVWRLHQEPTYRVLCLGAAPGQPFLGPNDAALAIRRQTTPRVVVPDNSLAVAGRTTTIYPVAMPGGWNLIGEALTRVYDPHRSAPFLLEPGDHVRLVPGTGPSLAPLAPVELLPAEPRFPALRVEQPGPLDLVVDGGRRNHGHHGIAESGPLDAAAARLANALVGNAPGAPLVETTLYGPSLVVLAPVVIGVAGAGALLEVDGEAVGSETVRLRRGDRVRIRATGRGVRGYLAVGGGIATGAFAGSASVDLRGRIGRPLRAGDLLGLATVPGGAPPTLSARVEPGDRTAPIRLVRGPQWTAEAERALEAGTFAVAAGDRTGIRLDGSDVPGGELLSEAPMLGAVQVTTGGSPIILLNDRLRLAGYHKPGVVVPADLGRVAQLRPGEAVRFQFVGEPARAWYRDL